MTMIEISESEFNRLALKYDTFENKFGRKYIAIGDALLLCSPTNEEYDAKQ